MSAPSAKDKDFVLRLYYKREYQFLGKVTVEGSSSGLQQIDADSNQSDSIYNLNGQRVNNPSRGIYIVNGRKVIVK